MKLLILALVLISTTPLYAASVNDCGGCAKVVEITTAFRALGKGEMQAPTPLLKSGLTAVQGLIPNASGHLNAAQARVLVELLKVSFDKDFAGYILDGNTALVRRNEGLLMAAAKRLSATDAGNVIDSLETALQSESSDYVAR